MILRRACAGEDKIAYQCIEDARAYHRSLGFVQWHPGYPTLQTIKDDIDAGVGCKKYGTLRNSRKFHLWSKEVYHVPQS